MHYGILKTITQKGNIETRQMNPIFHLLFELCLSHSFLLLKIDKILFHAVHFGLKIPEFWIKDSDSERYVFRK